MLGQYNTILIERADRLASRNCTISSASASDDHTTKPIALSLTGEPSSMTPDALKRLEAIERRRFSYRLPVSHHDLEIRGAGELLGEDQGRQHANHRLFTLYGNARRGCQRHP